MTHSFQEVIQTIRAEIAKLQSVLKALEEEMPGHASAPGSKERISAAGRKRIREATKKRWAEFHAKQRQAAKTKK